MVEAVDLNQLIQNYKTGYTKEWKEGKDVEANMMAQSWKAKTSQYGQR